MAETIGSIQVVATINTKDYDAGKKHIEKSNDDLEKSSEKASGGMALKWSSAFKSIAAVAAARPRAPRRPVRCRGARCAPGRRPGSRGLPPGGSTRRPPGASG